MPKKGMAQRITTRITRKAKPRIKTGRKRPLISVALRGKRKKY